MTLRYYPQSLPLVNRRDGAKTHARARKIAFA
jgi:hypothetical protein